MTQLLRSRTLTVSVKASPDRVYQFVSNPVNLPVWAPAFCRSIQKSDGQWIVQTPGGPARIQFAEPNGFGVLDHTVIPAPGLEIDVPMRVVPNGSGSEVIFTLFQLPGVSEGKFDEDAQMVERDLHSLKDHLER